MTLIPESSMIRSGSSSQPSPKSPDGNRRWAVILAGGDGTRLQELTQFLYGQKRPKQFCALVDDQTLLAHTRRRAAACVPPSQTLFALSEAHRPFFETELVGLESQRVVQPENRGTAPPILYCLKSIAAMDPEASISVLPSDHHYRDEGAFQKALESAFAASEVHPDSLILLGAYADRLELEYGWIELGPLLDSAHPAIRQVRAFREKPSPAVAARLLNAGSVWNTFVMVGKAKAFLDQAQSTVPHLMQRLDSIPLWNHSEVRIAVESFDRVPQCDFSREVLSGDCSRLLVQYQSDLGWSDLGQPARVFAALRESTSAFCPIQANVATGEAADELLSSSPYFFMR